MVNPRSSPNPVGGRNRFPNPPRSRQGKRAGMGSGCGLPRWRTKQRVLHGRVDPTPRDEAYRCPPSQLATSNAGHGDPALRPSVGIPTACFSGLIGFRPGVDARAPPAHQVPPTHLSHPEAGVALRCDACMFRRSAAGVRCDAGSHATARVVWSRQHPSEASSPALARLRGPGLPLRPD